jgi:hypothetical protein
MLPVFGLASLAIASPPVHGDWLTGPVASRARIVENPARHEIVLENSLVRRRFRTPPTCRGRREARP